MNSLLVVAIDHSTDDSQNTFAQFVMQAIVRTKEHAMDWYPTNVGGWGTSIQILHELATVKDVKRLNAYCKNNKYNEYLGDDDLDAYKSWSRAFQGEHLYYLIRYGISRP